MSSTRVRVDKDVPLFKELFNIDDRYSDMSPLVLVRQGLHCPHTPPAYRPFCLSVSVSVSPLSLRFTPDSLLLRVSRSIAYCRRSAFLLPRCPLTSPPTHHCTTQGPDYTKRFLDGTIAYVEERR